MQPVVVKGFAELRDAGITRTGYELHGLLFMRVVFMAICSPFKCQNLTYNFFFILGMYIADCIAIHHNVLFSLTAYVCGETTYLSIYITGTQ